MATAEQIRANRANAQKSTGPRNTDVTRFNGLTHGLRAEQVYLPGESLEECEAERRGWVDDWGPLTHTRAVLVERAFAASWKLRRATRCEKARLHDLAADVDHEFRLTLKGVVEGGLGLLPRFPAEGVSRFRSHSAGLDCLIGLWEALAVAAGSGWTSRQDHHDRLVNLLGHVAGREPADLGAARASLVLLRADGAIAEGPAPGASEVAEARATLGALCAGRAEEFRRERSQYQDPEAYRLHLIDRAVAPTSKEAQLLHRYEREHEKALYAAIRGLLALERSGADLPEPIEPEPPSESDRPETSIANQDIERLAKNWLRSGRRPRRRAARPVQGGRRGRRGVPTGRTGPIRGRRRPRYGAEIRKFG